MTTNKIIIVFRRTKRIKLNIFLMVLVISLCGCNKEKNSGEMDVVNSRTLLLDNCYSEYITIIVNLPQINDYEDCAQTIIEHYILNDFMNTDFNFDDIGYPYELNATVFLTESDLNEWNPIFEMSYKTNSYDYNIKENPEYCTLEVIETLSH